MKYTFYEAYNLQMVEYGHDFDTEEVERHWSERLGDPKNAARTQAPMLIDLRKPRLLRLEAADIRRLARARQQFGGINSKVCCWVSEDGSFGMLRMYAAYAEIFGVRREEDFEIHLMAPGILTWLTDVAGLTSRDAQGLIADLL